MTHTTSTLNDVIEIVKDGEEGFRTAAEDIENPELKVLFRDFSQQRARFAAELQSLARAEGEPNPDDHGSIGGALHRGWIDLKSALASRDELAILSECERGEDVAVSTYQKAIDDMELPGNVRQILRDQYTQVKATHDRVRDLRDRRRAMK